MISCLQVWIETVQAMSQFHREEKKKQKRIRRIPTYSLFIFSSRSSSWVGRMTIRKNWLGTDSIHTKFLIPWSIPNSLVYVLLNCSGLGEKYYNQFCFRLKLFFLSPDWFLEYMRPYRKYKPSTSLAWTSHKVKYLIILLSIDLWS